MNQSAIGMTHAEFPQHIGGDAQCARFLAVELDVLAPTLAIQKMARYRRTRVTMGVAMHVDRVDAGGEPFQCPGFKYHERLQQGAEQPKDAR
jgi:hypothetical protein